MESLIEKCESSDNNASPIEFATPSSALMETWIRHMRNDRGNKAKSIETWVGGVSATCRSTAEGFSCHRSLGR